MDNKYSLVFCNVFILFVFSLMHIKGDASGSGYLNGYVIRGDSVRPPLGLCITKSNFDLTVEHVINQFESANNIKTIDDYLTFVRVYNTYGFFNLKDNYDSTIFSVWRNNIIEITRILEAHVRGSFFYSEKYDLVIGGGRTKNNFYRIESKCELPW